MVAICCVCGIEKDTLRGFNLTFHSFPKSEDLRLKWYEVIGKKVYHNACICSKHFKMEDYKNHEDPNLIRRLLKPSAIPDNNLCKELEFKNSLFNTENNNDESIKFVNHANSEYENSIIKNEISERLQVHESNVSIKINNPVAKRILDETISYFAVNQQLNKRKNEDTLHSVKKQEYLNVVSEVMRKEDFKNVNAWLRFQKYINKMRKQHKFLLHKNRRLHLKLNNFKDMLNTLRTK